MMADGDRSLSLVLNGLNVRKSSDCLFIQEPSRFIYQVAESARKDIMSDHMTVPLSHLNY